MLSGFTPSPPPTVRPSLKRPAAPPCHLAVEGGVGVGKSTCVAALAAAYASDPSVVVVPEPVDAWRTCGILRRMYDGSATMLEFQLVAVSTLAGALLRAMQGHSIRLVITERSVGGNRTIFARPGLTAECLAAYDTVYASLMAALPPRDSYTLYLHAPADVIAQRVASRGRPEERGLSADFHRELHERHSAYLAALDHPHSCIDAAGPASSVAGAVIGVAEALRRGEPPPPGGLAVARARGEDPD